MLDPHAQDRLEAISYLLERTRSYQRASAGAALAGGLLSLALASAMLVKQTSDPGLNIDARVFFEWWSLVFFATLFTGAFLLWREAQGRGESLYSTGLKLALSSMLPALFAGTAISGCLTLTSGLPLFPTLFWLVFYGLALLSTHPFAPTATVALGWAFLLSGIGAFIYLMNETIMPEFDLPTPTNLYPAAIMGATFGLFHLLYAAWVWPRRAASGL